MASLALPLFTIAIFLGAALVFGVQPLAARILLPSFGGSPAVWNATMLFFQLALLAGYLYSFVLTRRVPARYQPIVHLVTLALPLAFLPLGLQTSQESGDGLGPAFAVLGALTLGVGVPFTIASTTGPLLQRWFSYTNHPAGRDPYFLYAASNTGSLLVLLAYPFLVEPRLTLAEQSTAWSIGYLIFAVLAIACGGMVVASTRTRDEREEAETVDAPLLRLTWITRGRWVALAAVPSALSLGVTQHITTDVAAVPLLWIAPLSLYLASFIVAFSRRNPISSAVASRILPVPVLAVLGLSLAGAPIAVAIVIHLTLLFVAAVMCHTRLAEERPHPSQLTEFYLLLSVGGALGGVFVSLVAPVAFDHVWEYPIAIVGVLLLRRGIPGRPSRTYWLLLGGTAAGLLALLLAYQAGLPIPIPLVAAGVGAVLLTTFRWRWVPAVMTAALLWSITTAGGSAIYTDRTFFGVHRVVDQGDRYLLVHGTTIHGMQFHDPELQSTPPGYYHPSGPIGSLLGNPAARYDRVGVVGLGLGTLAMYGTADQHFTFYEIDPAVVTIARDTGYFHFLRRSAADIEIVVGDGRLALEASPDRYDLLVLDAFSSDAIPIHLMTREAVATYLERITLEGLLAFHISNRHLDLRPVLTSIAQSLGLSAVVWNDRTITDEQKVHAKISSTWVVLTRNPASLNPLEGFGWTEAPFTDQRVWTDDYSDIIGALR